MVRPFVLNTDIPNPAQDVPLLEYAKVLSPVPATTNVLALYAIISSSITI
jgi:hypothetical protein